MMVADYRSTKKGGRQVASSRAGELVGAAENTTQLGRPWIKKGQFGKTRARKKTQDKESVVTRGDVLVCGGEGAACGDKM